MNTLKVFVDFECLHDKNNMLIIKELAIAKMDGSVQSWMFASPHPYDDLPQRIKCQNHWATTNLHKISWFDGDVAYTRLLDVLQKHIPTGSCVYVKGKEKASFLNKMVCSFY